MYPNVLQTAIRALTQPAANPTTNPSTAASATPDATLPPYTPPVASPMSPNFSGDDVLNGLQPHHFDFLSNATSTQGIDHAMAFGLDNNLTGDQLYDMADNGHFDKDQATSLNYPSAAPTPPPVAPPGVAQVAHPGMPFAASGFDPNQIPFMLPSQDYSSLKNQLQTEMQSGPAYPSYTPPALNPLQAALFGLGAILDPHHAASDVAGGLNGVSNYNNYLYGIKRQKYEAAETSHQRNLAVIEGMLGQQNERDRSVMGAQEAYMRDLAQWARYSSANYRSLQAQFDRAPDPQTAIVAGQALQEAARQMGVQGPTDAQINLKAKQSANPLVKTLQAEIDRQVHGAFDLDPTDLDALNSRREGLKSMVLAVDGTPLLGDSDLPNIPTSAQYQKIKEVDRVAHSQELMALANQKFSFAKNIAATRERDTTVRLQQAQERIKTGVGLLMVAKDNADTKKLLAANQIINDGTADVDKESENLYKQANDKSRSIGAQIAGVQSQAQNGDRKASAKLSELQTEQAYWDKIAGEANTSRTTYGLAPIVDEAHQQLLNQLPGGNPIAPTAPVNPISGAIGATVPGFANVQVPGLPPGALPPVSGTRPSAPPPKPQVHFDLSNIPADVLNDPAARNEIRTATNAINHGADHDTIQALLRGRLAGISEKHGYVTHPG